jgi:uncharacterized protein
MAFSGYAAGQSSTIIPAHTPVEPALLSGFFRALRAEAVPGQPSGTLLHPHDEGIPRAREDAEADAFGQVLTMMREVENGYTADSVRWVDDRMRPTGARIVETCEGCGACCLHVGRPMFLPTERAALPPALRSQLDNWDELTDRLPDYWWWNVPCFWLDLSTMRCRHYGHRPEVCREFEMGGDDCHEILGRRQAGE